MRGLSMDCVIILELVASIAYAFMLEHNKLNFAMFKYVSHNYGSGPREGIVIYDSNKYRRFKENVK